jgi:hypothetical protein
MRQKRLSEEKRKARQGCGLPGFYKGWVSKHNPYTILKRISSTEKLFYAFFQNSQKMLTRYPQ